MPIPSLVDWAQIVAAGGSAAAAFFAWKTIAVSQQSQQDDELLEHVQVTLERAHQALMGGAEPGTCPPPNRFNWLTAARLLETYPATKMQIKDGHVLLRCQDHEEYWRNQFYQSISLVEATADYFPADPQVGSPVDPHAAVIVYSFTRWPQDRADPLDRYSSILDTLSAHPVSRSWVNLRRYLTRAFPNTYAANAPAPNSERLPPSPEVRLSLLRNLASMTSNPLIWITIVANLCATGVSMAAMYLGYRLIAAGSGEAVTSMSLTVWGTAINVFNLLPGVALCLFGAVLSAWTVHRSIKRS